MGFDRYLHLRTRAAALPILAAIILAPVFVQASPGSDIAWTSFRKDLSNSGSAEVLLISGGQPSIDGEARIGDPVTTTVVGSGGRLVLGTDNGTLLCLDSASLDIAWTAAFPASILSTPVLAPDDDAVFACDSSGNVRAFRLSNGRPLWNWSLGSEDNIISSPSFFDGRIFFGSYDSSFYCLDASTGDLEWRFLGCSGWIHTSPSLLTDGGRTYVYFGACDGSFNCVDAKTGELVWAFHTSYIPSSPALYGGRVYFGSAGGDQRLYCLDAFSGRMVWNRSLPQNIDSSPAVMDDKVAVGCNDGKLYMMDASNGELQWSVKVVEGKLGSSPILTSDSVVCSGRNGLYMLNRQNGSIASSFEVGNAEDVSPSFVGGKVLFGTAEGYLYSISAGEAPDDDDDVRDLNEERDLMRDAIILVIAVLVIGAVGAALYFGKYRKMRQN